MRSLLKIIRLNNRSTHWCGSLAFAAGAASAFLLSAPASGDWLVTQDGQRIETQGPWEIEGRRVVYTSPSGQLQAIRTSHIDLEASRLASAPREVEAAPTRQPEPKRNAVAVLTDKDLPPLRNLPATPGDEPTDATEEAGEAQAQESPSPRPDGGLVVDWTEVTRAESEGVELEGTVRNPNEHYAVAPKVTIRLFDETGGQVAESAARIAMSSLGPGNSATFSASFPGVFAYRRVEVETKHQALQAQAARAPAARSTAEGR